MSWPVFLNHSLRLLVFPAVALVFSGLLTWICIRVFPRLGMMDIPRGRHAHEKAVPLGGGIAIAISFFVVAGIYAFERAAVCGNGDLLQQLKHLGWPALLILATGIADDRYELSSWMKLAAQIIAGVLIYFLDGGIYILYGWHIPMGLGLLFTVVWVVAIINAFNLIDGLDGLAAGLASISAFTIAMWLLLHEGMPDWAAMMLIFSGACLGFLRFNFHPARIFMGDTGSMFIGLVFAFINSNQITKSVTVSSLLLPLLAIGVPVFDVFLAVWRRSMRKLNDPECGCGIMSADSDHLHHRILRRTRSQSRTALILYLIAVGFSVAGVLLALVRNMLPALIFVVVLAGVFWVIKLADLEVRDSLNYIAAGVARPGCRLVLAALHPVIDMVIFSASFFLIYMLVLGHHSGFPLLLCYAVFVLPFMLLLYFSGVYRTYWLRAGINRYWLLMKMVALGGIVDLWLIYFLHGRLLFGRRTPLFSGLSAADTLSAFLMYFAVAAVMIFGERFVMRYMECFGLYDLLVKTGGEGSDGDAPERVLLVGGGLSCRLYITWIHCRSLRRKLDIIGIADDNRAVRKLNVYGFDVLGGIADLEDIYAEKPFDRLVLTMNTVAEPVMAEIREFCRRNAVAVSIFTAGENTLPPDEIKECLENDKQTVYKQ